MSDKIYVGSGKLRKTDWGDRLSLSFSKKDLETMLSNLNEKGYINIDLSERKEPGKFGETHYMTVNNWKPGNLSSTTKNTQKDWSSVKKSGSEVFGSNVSIDEIPF